MTRPPYQRTIYPFVWTRDDDVFIAGPADVRGLMHGAAVVGSNEANPRSVLQN
jgi:hypothetical protein